MKLKLTNENLYYILGSEFIRIDYSNPDDRKWLINSKGKTPYDLSIMVKTIKGISVNIENSSVVDSLKFYTNQWEMILKNSKNTIAQNAREEDKLKVNGVVEVCDILKNIDCDLNSKTTFGLLIGLNGYKLKEILLEVFTSPEKGLMQKELCKAVYENSLKDYEHPTHIQKPLGVSSVGFDAVFKASVDFFKYWTTQVLSDKNIGCDEAMNNLNKAFVSSIKNATGAKNYYKSVDKILTKKKASDEQIKKYTEETIIFLKEKNYFTQIDEFNELLQKSGNVVGDFQVTKLNFNGESTLAKNLRLSSEAIARQFSVPEGKSWEINERLLNHFRTFLTLDENFEKVALEIKGSRMAMSSYLSIEYGEHQKEKIEPLVNKYYKIFLDIIPLLKNEDVKDLDKMSQIMESAVTKVNLEDKFSKIKLSDDVNVDKERSFKL